MTAETTTDAAGVSQVERGVRPRAWLCELAQEDGTTRTQFVEEDPDGLRWNDVGEPSPYRTTPLYEAPRWVSTDMDLPDDGQSVLFVVRAKHLLAYLDGRVLGGTYRAGRLGCIGDFSIPGMSTDASHWMPMPEPPPLVGTGPNVRAKRPAEAKP